jgi:quercetin dioxygenase-like cupin family protein
MTSSIKRVEKGWGYELWIVNKKEYCGKLLFFEKEKQCSWHHHNIKDETFYLQSGKIKLFYGEDADIKRANVKILLPGDKFHIPVGMKHRMYAIEKSELFEFSTEHFDSDSYRILKGD